MDSVTVARSMRGSIGMLAMDWLLAPSTRAKAHAAGMPEEGFASYAIGRLGVLGDCPVDNVVGAAFFFEPTFLRDQIRIGRAAMRPSEGAAGSARICQEWGAEKLAGFDVLSGPERAELRDLAKAARSHASAGTARS